MVLLQFNSLPSGQVNRVANTGGKEKILPCRCQMCGKEGRRSQAPAEAHRNGGWDCRALYRNIVRSLNSEMLMPEQDPAAR